MTNNPDPAALLNVREAAALLRVSKSKLYLLIADGCIAPLKLGRSTRFRRGDLLAFVDALPRASRGKHR